MTVTERFGWSAKADAGNVNEFVKIIADNKVATAGAGDTVIGFIRWKDNPLPGDVTVETIFHNHAYVVFSETITAGDWLKAGAPNGTVQRFAKWVQGTDAEKLRVGICIVGGSANATGEMLF